MKNTTACHYHGWNAKGCPFRKRNNSACKRLEDGRIMSYSTTILQIAPGGQVVLNRSKYSVTTSHHQGHLWAHIEPEEARTAIRLVNVPQGTLDLVAFYLLKRAEGTIQHYLARESNVLDRADLAIEQYPGVQYRMRQLEDARR